jgi:hypothetical protein
MVQSTKQRPHLNAPGALDVPPDGCILAQRQMREHRVVMLHVTFEDMAQVLLACHTMWSRHSRRIEPIRRSAYPFCQGDRGEVG